MLAAILTICGAAQAQNQPAGMRVEVAEAETDHGDYSIFTYKDTDEDDSFGYYLSLGRVSDFLGADELLGMEVKNLHEVTVRLGGTTDEALATIPGAVFSVWHNISGAIVARLYARTNKRKQYE